MHGQSSEQSHPAHYWLATDAETAQVASHLSVSLAPGDAKELTENFSRIFLFDGSDGEQRVVKIRARWMTEKRLKFEHALAEHLRDCGLPMVAPVTDEQGCTWAKVGDLFCEVAPYIDGREASPVLADVRSMGTMLGHFHRCSVDLDDSLYEPPYFQNQVEPQELEAMVRQLGSDPLSARWKELADCYYSSALSLPQVLRHGDFHPWNLLFSRAEPGRITALFDLDMAAKGPRSYDISYAIFFLRNLHPECPAEGWHTRYRRFIESYADTSDTPFTEAEAEVVPLQIECIALHFLVIKAADAGLEAAADEYEKYITVVDWLQTWGPKLTEILGCGGLA